jgi:hypothetical protein
VWPYVSDGGERYDLVISELDDFRAAVWAAAVVQKVGLSSATTPG